MSRTLRITPVRHGSMARPISQLLEDKRRRDGVLDIDGAGACNVNQSTYNRWREGKSVPREEHHPALARWLKITEKRVMEACGEQRRMKLKTRLRVVGHLPDRRRTSPELDSALRGLESEVERQGREMAEIKKGTEELKKLLTDLLQRRTTN
jgi:transcriptional regulator with XRE-family HTH domain